MRRLILASILISGCNPTGWETGGETQGANYGWIIRDLEQNPELKPAAAKLMKKGYITVQEYKDWTQLVGRTELRKKLAK